MGGERDVRYATASRMVVSSASDSSLPTSALSSWHTCLGCSSLTARLVLHLQWQHHRVHIAAQSPDTLTQQCEDA